VTRRPLQDLFHGPLPPVGMVHLLPLPGSPRWGGSMDAVVRRALVGSALQRGGVAGGGVEERRAEELARAVKALRRSATLA